MSTQSIGLEGMRVMCEHPLSRALPLNRFQNAEESIYTAVKPEYAISGRDDKTDFLDEKNPNIGWKLHLNVEPYSLSPVVRFLRGEGYDHKFLTGGEIDGGKVFTIYVGSWDKTVEAAAAISASIEDFLSRPVDGKEMEFARGVIGRFFAKNGPTTEEFHQYGSAGLSWLKSDKELLAWGRNKDGTKLSFEQLAPGAEKRAFDILKKAYGNYFIN